MPDPRPLERASGSGPQVANVVPRSPRERAEDFVRWTVVLLGCSIPVSVAVDNILLAFILCCWFLGGGYRGKFDGCRRNPVALAALALVALYFVGTLYTIGEPGDVLTALSKAARLLLIPALMPLMRAGRWRRRGLGAFLASMLVTLVLSYLLWSGLLPANTWLKGTAQDPVVFKAHITHNVFMAFAAFVFAVAAVDAKSRRWRIVMSLLCIAAVANVLVMVPGRTGHVVLLVLFAYFLYRELGTWGVAIAGVVLGALAAFVVLSPDSMLHKRFTLAEDELQQWRAGMPADVGSSIGQRLDILSTTVEVIRGNPMLGVGTGGFGAAYASLASRTGATLSVNPHNEFLMIVAQFGLAGGLLVVCLFGTQWWLAGRLDDRFDQSTARGFVLTIVVASLLSSTLVDHAEGFFFAYMGGLLFAGYEGARARGRAATAQRLGGTLAKP
jgi:O-antigen ligase